MGNKMRAKGATYRREVVAVGVAAALAGAGCGEATGHDGSGGSSSAQGGGAGRSSGGTAPMGGGVGVAGENTAGTTATGGATNGNVFTAEIRSSAVDKVDLLLMIDNSISMADKQAVLADAVGALLNRLVTPICVVNGKPVGTTTDANGACATGAPEFPPLRDIHIGVVSSSLGGHGGQVCADVSGDDRGQLVPIVRPDPNVTTWNQSGFLYWDPRGRGTPPGQSNVQAFQNDFRNMVLAVGQIGCGFESSLEGWYRFLIDPQPIISTPQVTDGTVTRSTYNDDIATNPVLQQRAAFLRPDSVVVVAMLSDENDCSIIDQGMGWLVGAETLNNSSFRMPRSTSACAANPNDPCCASCAAASAGPGCSTPPSQDAACKAGAFTAPIDDALNLRCYRQKERFGFDLLYPTDRYVKGLSEYQIENRDGQIVENPLFANPAGPPRDRSLVHLVGIVGVPWQDLAVDPAASALVYKSYGDIDWELILGSPGDSTTPPTPPSDRLMYESIVDRTTLFGNAPHPLIGMQGALAPATATGRPNVINGHESNILRNDDLQYACIFQLPTPRTSCTGAACDCDAEGQEYNRPVCEQGTQTHSKAYPGVRELQVLKDFGAASSGNAVVASICPKTLSVSKTDPSYGYLPAVASLIDQVKQNFAPRCLPRQLAIDENGRVPCSIIESSAPLAGQACSECLSSAGRSVPSADERNAVLNQLRLAGQCSAAGHAACETFCLCALEQYEGADLSTCLSAPNPPTDIAPGFCYVDPAQASDASLSLAESQVVASCPSAQKRLIRFLGSDSPQKGAIVTIACGAQTARP